MKIRWYFLVVFVVLFCAGRGWFFVTDGFSIENISGSVEPDVRYDAPALSLAKKEELSAIFSTPFTYLGKGCQSYVFSSQDGKYVLKFFKQKHLKLPIYYDLLPYSIANDLKNRREAKRNLLYKGCYLAYTKAKDLSGLIALHLTNSDPVDCFVTLVDKLGFSHTINLNEFPFLVQKKGESIKEMDDKKLASLLEKLEQRGLKDLDPAHKQNVGYLDGELFFMDVGQFANLQPQHSPQAPLQCSRQELH